MRRQRAAWQRREMAKWPVVEWHRTHSGHRLLVVGEHGYILTRWWDQDDLQHVLTHCRRIDLRLGGGP